MRVLVFLILSLVILSSPMAHAQNYKAEIKSAEKLGKLIYKQDRAGWVATDELFEDKDYFAKVKPNLKGWLSLEDGKNYRTIFIGDDDGQPKAFYEVISKRKKIKESQRLDEGRPLSELEALRWKAIQTVTAEKFEYCREFLPMNTIVFPVPEDPENRLYVYLFSSSKMHGQIVFGKHYRFTLTADASTVLDKHDFAKNCIAVENLHRYQGKAFGAYISHVMQPYPEEHHVFANLLLQNLDLYVMTSETSQLWKVRKGKIAKAK